MLHKYGIQYTFSENGQAKYDIRFILILLNLFIFGEIETLKILTNSLNYLVRRTLQRYCNCL